MQLLETQSPPLPTIPLQAAQIFAADLAAEGGDFNTEVARRLEGEIAVAQLSGQARVDFGLAIHETKQVKDLAAEAELDSSIDSLIGQVIDLR